MKTTHRQYLQSATEMTDLADCSIDLVVTSPPYPMVEMWDESFIRQDPGILAPLEAHDGQAVFECMHRVLDMVWDELGRVVKQGRFACINIGDAVRKIGDEFRLYPNHTRIVDAMVKRGFSPLPCIIWRKQTNAPNKFMGSGMLPAGAYVTLEHEYILIFRKGGKRVFNTSDAKQLRRENAFFWEERNNWFSDVWMDLKGTRQQLMDSRVRKRSGAFPFDLPYRLVNMFSVTGDTVLDPFSGVGTTMLAAMASGRNSSSFEIEGKFISTISDKVSEIIDFSNLLIKSRIDRHAQFAEERNKNAKPMKYLNAHYGFPVVTRQETDLFFYPLTAVNINSRAGVNGQAIYTVHYDTSRPKADTYYTGEMKTT